MSLTANLLALAEAVARELKARITAEHPGVARAWACFGFVNGELKVRAAHNVREVTRLAAGKYRVTFDTPMPDAGYCWTAFARNTGNQGTLKFAAARVNAEAKSPGYVEVICATQAGTLTDTAELNLMVFR